jgi:DNA-binding LytR/AlgR family response regulator
VIITTAYHQYAVEGFNLSVADYLLKPFEFERFLMAVTKVSKAIARSSADTSGKGAPTAGETIEAPFAGPPKVGLFLNVQKKKVKILFSDILYIESQREYVKIVTVRNEYLSKLSTHEIEKLLPVNQFRRIHRSFIVSLEKIHSYSAEEVDISGVAIPVGRDYRHVLDNL